MYKVKIFGAGSIGNHLSHAARTLNWAVDIADVSEDALNRTKEEIYPSRYGKWDDSIGLYHNDNIPKNIYDLIIVGTPPDSHMELAINAIQEKPKAILIEKPLCTPDLSQAQKFFELMKSSNVKVFVGYDHVIGKASCEVGNIIQQNDIGDIETIDVEFREHWGGIFNAHPWLSGPQDTYLGYWKKGGGASGEHSHAINLWQNFAHVCNAGRVVKVTGNLKYVEESGTSYDKICALNLETEKGLIGRVVQDVVTKPPRKWGRVQGSQGFVEWYCGNKPNCDTVLANNCEDKSQEVLIEKNRPDDFILELKHIEEVVNGNGQQSPISIERGLDTMLIVAAAHKSAIEKRTVTIDYSKGYVPEALS